MPAATNGEQGNSLIRELLEKPQRFEYYMAVKLLQGYFGKNVRINTRPNLTLGFNANDIDHIAIYDLTRPTVSLDGKARSCAELAVDDLFRLYQDKDNVPVEFVLYVNFLGLYGSSSPLPVYYTEELIRDEADDNYSTTDFIAAVNNPVYGLYQKARDKYRIFQQLLESQPEYLLERIFSFAGASLGEIRKRFENPYVLFPYLGLLSMFPRSAQGLETILRGELPDCQVQVEEFVPSLEDIPECQLMRLGEDNCELGECCYLGNRINTIDGTVRLHILCRQEEIFSSLMPGREMYRKLGAIFQVYMIDRVRIMLRVRMENTRNADLTLGRLDNPLGISSFLGGLNRRQSQEYELPLAY